MKVLIAEDTDSVCFALRLAMKYLGHEVVATATDGEEAFAQYQRLRPEVVLMDVRMPLMDGLTCTAKLFEHDPNAKVVIITGGRTTRKEAVDAGARAFVEKPFDIAELGDVMQSLQTA
jgi:two-component system, chemotaxis family, chemotaxis protein CheY